MKKDPIKILILGLSSIGAALAAALVYFIQFL